MFSHLTLEDGLSQCTVLSIVQDHNGFLWFGTLDGLNRYDGYQFTTYKNIPASPNTISDDWITALYIDKSNTLWVGTLEGGLNRYNADLDNFDRFPLTFYYNSSVYTQKSLANIPFTLTFLNDHSITSIFEDSRGTLWVGTFGNGLFRFNRQDETFSHRPYDFFDRSGLSYNIKSITETKTKSGENILWIGTLGGGLLRFDEQNGFTATRHIPGAINSLINDQIVYLYPDPDKKSGLLWICTLGGLDCYNYEEGVFMHIRSQAGDPQSLCNNNVLSVLKDDQHALWIGTYEGLDRFDLLTQTFDHYHHEQENTFSINSERVYCLFRDRSNVIWAGTDFGHGLNKFDNAKRQFKLYRHEPGNKNSLSDNVILSICKDHNDALWIGAIEGGVTRIDPVTHEYTHYRHEDAKESSLGDNHIRDIHEDRNGTLWFGTFSDGLNRFDPQTGKFYSHSHQPDDPHSISANQVRCILEDRDGIMWIGTFGGGLNKFDRETKQFIHFRHEPDIPQSLSEDRIYHLAEDDSGYIWIATFDGGIDRFDKKNGIFTHHMHDPQNENSLSDNRVMIVSIDPFRPHTLWAGTFGGGLNRYDISSKTFTHYTTNEGLPNNVIYGILFDESGNLWLSSNNGIAQLNPESSEIRTYTISDGLQGAEFNAGSFYKCRKTGEMFFGGMTGLNSFFPSQVHMNQKPSPMQFTSFKIFGNETREDLGPIWQQSHLDLSYRDKVLSFEFSVLDFSNPQKNQYAYQLSNLHNDWIRCGTQHAVNFTNIAPGSYTLRVKGCNSDGVWNDAGISMDFTIHPPFWQTFWFYTISFLFIISIAVFLYRYRIRILVARSLEMERIRSAENEQVRRTLAADFHDELGQKLTRITLFSEILKRRLQNDARNDLEYVDKINDAAKAVSLSSRDFIWTINPSQDSLYDVALYIKDSGDELFDKTGVDFRIEGLSRTFETVKFPMEWRRHVILIFKEAMNNALKHAQCKHVNFKIQYQYNNVYLELKDDGIGCSNATPVSGHGVYNMKNRAETIGGNLQIICKQNKGTMVRFNGQIPQTGH